MFVCVRVHKYIFEKLIHIYIVLKLVLLPLLPISSKFEHSIIKVYYYSFTEFENKKSTLI